MRSIHPREVIDHLQGVEGCHGRIELPDATINEHEIGQRTLANLRERMEDFNIIVERVSVENIRLNDEFTVDILPSVAGIPFAELVPHIVCLDLGGEQVPVLDLEGLLKTKQGLRPKDQADAAVLRRALQALRRRVEPGPR